MILYKYLTAKKAKKWLIKRNAMLLTPPRFLNDLTEFRIRRVPVDEDEASELFRFFGGGPAHLEFTERILDTSFADGEPDFLKARLGESYGIVSFSENALNPLMMAHYCENSGVIIGYESIDEIHMQGLTARFLEWGPLFKVSYDESVGRNVINKDFGNVAQALASKDKHWDYEAEWRFFGKLALAST
jgi:hypothetical protein